MREIVANLSLREQNFGHFYAKQLKGPSVPLVGPQFPSRSPPFLFRGHPFRSLLTIGVFLLTVLASLLTVGAFFAYSGKSI